MAYSPDCPDSTRSTASPMSWITNAIYDVFHRALWLVDIFAKLFGWQASPQEHLHLHRAARQINTKPANAIRRSRSFRMRALLHQLFTGSGFVEPLAVGSA